MHGPTASGRPFNSDVIAAYAADIEIACERIAPNYLAGTLAYLAERLQKAANSDAEFFFELSPRRELGVLTAIVLSLRNRPGTHVAVTPERSAGMDEENLDTVVTVAIH